MQAPAGGEADTLPPDVQVGQERAALDQEAQETLQVLLRRMQGLAEVTVEVEAGLARLTGEVPSAETRERAAEVARTIEGVSYVDNRLTLSQDLSDQLSPAAERIRSRMGDLLASLPLLGLAALVVALFLLLARVVGGMERPYAAFSSNLFVRNVLRQVARGVVAFTGVLLAVEVLDITALVGAVVGTAGVAGLALGFAFKEIVENYLAGLLLSLRQPFDQNDSVALEGVTGKVVRLTSRETILLDLEGNHVRLPNATVFRSVLVNYTRNPRRRFEVELTVAADEDLARAMELGRRVLREMEGVLAGPAPWSRVRGVGESGVLVVWSGWVDQDRFDFLKVRSEALRLVLEALTDAGVAMPPPERRVRLVRERAPDEEAGPPEDAPRDRAEDAIEPGQQDVSLDHTLDAQIDADRRASDEEDLLTGGA